MCEHEEIRRALGVDCAGFYSPTLLTFEALMLIESGGVSLRLLHRVFLRGEAPPADGEGVPGAVQALPRRRAGRAPAFREAVRGLGGADTEHGEAAQLSLVGPDRAAPLGKGRSADALVAAAAARFAFVDAREFAANWPRSAPDLNPRVVLGISTTHETGAAIVRDGRVLAAVSEERLSRVKQDVSYPPVRSIAEVIRISGVAPADIEAVAIAGFTGGTCSLRCGTASCVT